MKSQVLKLSRALAGLSFLSLVLTGCGANTDPGKQETIRLDTTKDRRDSGEKFARTREEAERSEQSARVKSYKSNAKKANSGNSGDSKTPRSPSAAGSSRFNPSAASRSAAVDKLTSVGKVGLLGAVMNPGGVLKAGEKLIDKSKDAIDALTGKNENEDQASDSAQTNDNEDQAATPVPGKIRIVQEGRDQALLELKSVSDEEIECLFGSEDRMHAVYDIFNSAPGRKGAL